MNPTGRMADTYGANGAKDTGPACMLERAHPDGIEPAWSQGAAAAPPLSPSPGGATGDPRG